MSSLPSLDSTITHTCDTSDKHQLTLLLRSFFYILQIVLFFFSKFVKMNFPGVLPPVKKSQFVTRDRTPTCLHTILANLMNPEIIFFIKMFFFSCKLMEPSIEVVEASIELVKTSMDSMETSSFL